MWTFPEVYDCLVIGAGHAGCEAAYVAARMGLRVLLLTMNPDTIGKMSCNPAIGGTAKGQLVREIDALGGIMGKIADRTGIQFRMLNSSKGPAVWSPRCQSDKAAYATEMKRELEGVAGLEIKSGTTESLVVEGGKVVGVDTLEGIRYLAKSVVVSSGTFMRGLMHIGEETVPGGRAGDKPSVGLSKSLEELGFRLGRLKTGTPPRIHRRSIDVSAMEEQPGEQNVRFSHDEREPRLPQISCYITYTSERSKEIVLNNLHRAPMYSGKIHSVGPRYCPSIEDKFVRFGDKERHQIYLEPEGLTTSEVYLNGISTSLPFDVQVELVRSIAGLEKAEIIRAAYAIEYDYVLSGQVSATLETKEIEGLYFAGQINGTTGYEEAAAQGLIAGVNAALKVQGKEPFVLSRAEAYMGVLIDDLILKDHAEPYRMFTSRAEHRLLLRQDNADMRLREYGYRLGLIDEKQWDRFKKKREQIDASIATLKESYTAIEGRKVSLAKMLCRPELNFASLSDYGVERMGEEEEFAVEVALKYEGYIERQEREAEKLKELDSIRVPSSFDFGNVKGLRKEAQEKLLRLRPSNLGQASRVSGVSPADITVLMVALKR